MEVKVPVVNVLTAAAAGVASRRLSHWMVEQTEDRRGVGPRDFLNQTRNIPSERSCTSEEDEEEEDPAIHASS